MLGLSGFGVKSSPANFGRAEEILVYVSGIWISTLGSGIFWFHVWKKRFPHVYGRNYAQVRLWTRKQKLRLRKSEFHRANMEIPVCLCRVISHLVSEFSQNVEVDEVFVNFSLNLRFFFPWLTEKAAAVVCRFQKQPYSNKSYCLKWPDCFFFSCKAFKLWENTFIPFYCQSLLHQAPDSRCGQGTATAQNWFWL